MRPRATERVLPPLPSLRSISRFRDEERTNTHFNFAKGNWDSTPQLSPNARQCPLINERAVTVQVPPNVWQTGGGFPLENSKAFLPGLYHGTGALSGGISRADPISLDQHRRECAEWTIDPLP